MKKYSVALWLVLCTSVVSFAQSASYFTITLGIFTEPKREDFQSLHTLGFLYSSKMENNHAQIFLGGFDSRSMADNALVRVHNAGYTGAAVLERSMQEGSQAIVIQLGTADIRKPINWQAYEKTPELWGITSGELLKLVVGPYRSQQEAREALVSMQGLGFKDAFIRTINSVYLIKIGAFETGNTLKQPLVAFKWNTETQPSSTKPTPKTAPVETPPSYSYPSTPKQAESTVPVVPPSTVPPSTVPRMPQPETPAEYNSNFTAKGPATVRGNVKRRAALELQKVLKAENLYTGSLDGFYGQGTAQGYQKALAQNNILGMYQLVVIHTPAGAVAGSDALQNAINRLSEDTRFVQTLESYNHPIAKAYRAYLKFVAVGPIPEVNNLMNEAIRQAYANVPARFTSPFDYQATYAYNDLNQLILHLYYIHIAPNMAYSTPCWLSKQHPQETARAQAALSGLNAAQQIQSCDPFSEWEETRMLEALATDLGGEAVRPAKNLEAAAARAALFLANRPLSENSQRDLENWHNTLLTNLNNWATRDPLHERMCTPFKILFYQSAVRLEEFFMDKGFGSEEAKSLALATLRTMVGPRLERFQ